MEQDDLWWLLRLCMWLWIDMVAHCLDLPTCAPSTWSTQPELETLCTETTTRFLHHCEVIKIIKDVRSLPTFHSILNLIYILSFSLPSHISVVIIIFLHLSSSSLVWCYAVGPSYRLSRNARSNRSTCLGAPQASSDYKHRPSQVTKSGRGNSQDTWRKMV